MSQVISATTRFVGKSNKYEEFLSKAYSLLALAREEFERGEGDIALETAYRAALRTAGAQISQSKVAKRVRKPQGAWAQLRMVDDMGVEWAEFFEGFSRIRSRVASGIEYGVSDAIVAELITGVSEFIQDVESGWTHEGLAA